MQTRNVYTNTEHQPQHLAVPNEHAFKASDDMPACRPLCGANTQGLEITEVGDLVALPCKVCNEQLQMRIEMDKYVAPDFPPDMPDMPGGFWGGWGSNTAS